MLTRLAKKKRQQAMIVIWMQIATIVVAAIFAYMISGVFAMKSLLLGGGVCIIPEFIFVYKLFSEISAQAAKRIVYRLYLAELFKFICIGFLAVVILKWVAVAAEAFIAGIILTQFTLIFAPWIIFFWKPHP